MAVKHAINLLRKRFNRLRAGQTFLDLQDAVHVPRARLSVFASGGMLKLADIEQIERWCDQMDRPTEKKKDTHGTPTL